MERTKFLTEITHGDDTYRIGERVRVGDLAGEIIQIDSTDTVHVDLGEGFDDGDNDGFTEVHVSMISK